MTAAAAIRFYQVIGSVVTTARRGLANLALPPICAGCEQDLETPADAVPLCQACRRTFSTPAESICSRCAAPAPAASIRDDGCLHCRDTKFHFERILALGVYQGPLQAMILRMKHASGESLAIAAGRLLAQQIREVNWQPRPELVTAVPMHWTRRIASGNSAAALLAEAVAAELKLPLALDAVRTIRRVPRQSSLTPARRRHNMRSVFQVSAAYNLRDAHLLVLDDVFTTGATANALARVLHRAGAATVSLGIVARGIGAH